MGNRTPVSAYLRVSTEAQAESSVSLNVQLGKVQAYADFTRSTLLPSLKILAFTGNH